MNRGAPIAVDYLPLKPKGIHPIQVTINCGNYNHVVVIEYQSEANAAHGFMMWQELILAAQQHERDL
jgi:hypothetical protein